MNAVVKRYFEYRQAGVKPALAWRIAVLDVKHDFPRSLIHPDWFTTWCRRVYEGNT